MLHCLFSSRNFPDQFDQNKAAVESGLQKETLVVKKWIDENPFVLSANFHGGSLVANYPYDDTPNKRSEYSATSDDDIFRKLALTYSKNHPTMHLNKAQCDGDNFKDGKICVHRGCYTVARRYEFYFLVAKQYFTNEHSK